MSETKPITLLCAANTQYTMPLTVMLTSVVSNLRSGRPLHVHVITSDIAEPAQIEIERSIKSVKTGYSELTFNWYTIDIAGFARFFSKGHLDYISPDTYSRLLAPEVLPASVKQVIYLDCDLVVLADLAALSDAADPAYTVGAVSNVWFPYVSSMFDSEPVVFNYAELGIPASNRYFQCGVLVINLERWRERSVTVRAFEYLAEHRSKVRFHDQGALNAILYDDWFRLDQRWNQVSTALHPERWTAPAYSHSDWLTAKSDPFVVHYDGHDKPWKANFKKPRSSFFLRYLRKTPFAAAVRISPFARIESVIGYNLYYKVWRLKVGLASILRGLRPA